MVVATKTHFLAFIWLVLITLIWSYNWIAMKAAMRYMEAFDLGQRGAGSLRQP